MLPTFEISSIRLTPIPISRGRYPITLANVQWQDQLCAGGQFVDLAAYKEMTLSEQDDSVRHGNFVVLLRLLLYGTRI